MKELIEIQFRLNAPKGQTNDFGHYKYRSAEDILAAVKPLLKEQNCILLLSDEVKEVGQEFQLAQTDSKKGTSMQYKGTRVYVEATATIINSKGDKLSVKALAREEPVKAGMDAAQITGSASSYARKYALNGLFAIDNENDPDSTNNGQQPSGYAQNFPPAQPQQQTTGDVTTDDYLNIAIPQIEQATTKEQLMKIYNDFPTLQSIPAFKNKLSARRKALGIKNANEKK